MPEMRHYVVTQTRSVEVTANSAADAALIASAAFKNGQNSRYSVIDGPTGVWGNTTSRIQELALKTEKVR